MRQKTSSDYLKGYETSSFVKQDGGVWRDREAYTEEGRGYSSDEIMNFLRTEVFHKMSGSDIHIDLLKRLNFFPSGYCFSIIRTETGPIHLIWNGYPQNTRQPLISNSNQQNPLTKGVDDAFDEMVATLGRIPTKSEFEEDYKIEMRLIINGKYHSDIRLWNEYVERRGYTPRPARGGKKTINETINKVHFYSHLCNI